MTKFKLSKTFLKVGKILAIVGMAVFAVCFLVFTILGIVGIVAAAASEGTDEEIAEAVGAAVLVLVGAIIEYLLLAAACLVSLILNSVASKGLAKATSKAEAKKPAILAIVSGALITTFGIPAGILLLCTNDKDWEAINASKPAAEPVDVKPIEAEATETEVK